MRTILLQVSGAVACAILAFYGIWWLLIPTAVLYQYRVSHSVLIFIAFFIDVYFDRPLFDMWLTMGALVLYVVMMVLQPHLRYSE